MTPEEYCQEKAASSGSSFYTSFRFLPPARRAAITALYAFCREVDDVVDECSERDIALIKLAWWREEIERLFASTPAHPVTRALQPRLAEFNLSKELFLELIEGMEMDLGQTRYPDFKSLSLYCYRVASVVGLLAAEIFGYEERNTLKYAHALGFALQLTNIIRDVGEDALRGRIYLPQEDLERFEVSEIDILLRTPSPNFEALMAFEIARAQQYYDEAFNFLPKKDRKAQRPGLIMAMIYRTLLHEISEDPLEVLRGRVTLPARRKLFIALKTWLCG